MLSPAFAARRQKKRLPWRELALALVLVAAQMLLAGHQVCHLSAGPDSQHCPICALGGGLDHAVAADPITIPFQSPRVRFGVGAGRPATDTGNPLLSDTRSTTSRVVR